MQTTSSRRVAQSVTALAACLYFVTGAQAQGFSGPVSPNTNGALIGPQIAVALHPVNGTPQKPIGPLTGWSDWLANYGVSLRGVLINQMASNPVGGVRHGTSNVGQLNFGTDIDLQKMVGIPGGSFHLTLYRDYGYSLALETTGTFVKQQNIYKNPYTKLHLGLVAYEQKLFKEHLDIIIGRLGTTTFYGHLVPACSFQGGATCGVPAVLNSEAGFGLLPSATWGSNVTVHLTPDIYAEAGAFEVNPVISSTNGLDWSIEHATGYTIPVEMSWSRTNLRTQRYPFELKVGGYTSTAPHADPYYNTKLQSLAQKGGTARSDVTRDGMYVMADRVIWRPDPKTTENLNVFAGYIQPFEDEEVVDKEVYAGMLLTGGIPGRPRDSIGLVGTYLQVSPGEISYLHQARVKLGGSGFNSPDEGVLELNYGFEPIRYLRFTPNVQYIVNPDNSASPKVKAIPRNVLVFGLSMTVGFSQILGFAGGGGGSD